MALKTGQGNETFYTGPRWTITQTDKGGIGDASRLDGKQLLITHGNDAAILGGKVGSLYDYSQATDVQRAALDKELKRRHTIEERTKKRKNYQALAKVAAAALGGAALAAVGGAAAGGAGAAAGGGGGGAAGAAGAAGAGAAGVGATGATAGGIGAGAASGMASGVSAGLGGAGGAAAGAAGAGAAGTAAGGASALGGLAGYGKWANTAVQAYGAYDAAKEQKKLAKEAGKEKTGTTTRTPYYNEAIAQLARYILAEQQRVYESRQRIAGIKPGDYSPFAALLAQIPQNYRGV